MSYSQTQQSTSTALSSSQAFSTSNRYGSLIENSFSKEVKLSLFQFNTYLVESCPHLILVHNILTFIRLCQLIGPAFFIPFKFWNDHTISKAMLDIFSVVFHLLPSSVRGSAGLILCFVYVVFVFAFTISMCAAARYFQKNAKIGKWASNVLYFLLFTLGYYFHPVALECAGELLGNILLNFSFSTHLNELAAIVLVLISFIVFNVLLIQLLSTSVFCRPTSLFTFLGEPQRYLVILTGALTFTCAIASKTSGYIQIIFLSATILIYIASLLNSFFNGGFLNHFHQTLVCSFSASGALLCIELILLNFMKITGNELVLIIGIVEIAGLTFASHLYNNHKIIRAMKLLDEFETTDNSLDHIKNTRTFVECSITGFSLAHPSIMNWEFFTASVDKWPKVPQVWYIFTKCLAIYPEANQMFVRIFQQMFSTKLHGAGTKRLITEMISLQQHRETNMSPQMRRKINHVSKATWSLKNKMRQVWDLVIQGNANDIVGAISNSYDDLQKLETDYARLLRQFPNSRFVTRSYSRFILDIYADHEKYVEWAEKTKELQRGIAINEDIAHELGLIYFPNIPSVIQTGTSTIATDIGEGSSLLQEEEGEGGNLQGDQLISMRKTMESVRITGPANATIIRFLTFVICFIIPFLIFVVMVFSFASQTIHPLNYMSDIANLRNLAFMSTTFGTRVLYIKLREFSENRGDNPPIGWEKISELVDIEHEEPPSFLGGTWDEEKQFDYIRLEGASSLECIDQIDIDVTVGEETVDELLFNENLNYTLYTNPAHGNESSYKKMLNMKSACSQLIFDLSTLDSMVIDYTPNESVNPLRTVSMMNVIANTNLLAERCDSILGSLMHYISDLCVKKEKNYKIIMAVIIIIIVIIQVSCSIIETRMIHQSRSTIYKCMMTMPKNIISRVSDSLKSVKKETTDGSLVSDTSTEVNKQEENILKILATSGDSNKISGELEYIACTVLLCIFGGAMTGLLCDTYITVCVEVNKVAPHINYLMGAMSYQSGAYTALLFIMLKSQNNSLDFLTYDTLFEHFEHRLETSINFFDSARYGDESGRNPFHEFDAGINDAIERLSCTKDMLVVPTSWEIIYRCLSPDLLFDMGSDILTEIIEPIRQTPGHAITIDWNDDTLNYFWDMEFYYVYDKFFAPIDKSIDVSIENDIDSKLGPHSFYAAIFVILGLIATIAMLIDIKKAERKMRYALEMLLLCSPEPLLQNQLLTNVLAGRFESKSLDTSNHGDEFFRSIIQEMPDAIVICSLEGIIQEYNKAAERLFENRIEEAVGHSYQTFFEHQYFDQGTISDFAKKTPPAETETVYKTPNSDSVHLRIDSKQFPDRIVFSLQNITQAVIYQRLINEEKAKSDQMLASILPPSLVHRVQKGERKISFAVQSATITFMDIVQFTPWCAANTANMIMTTLNRLFKEFDAICATKPTLTKVKCIGDCYMAAGGVFMEVNQPAEHAREVVEFGLEAIKAVQKVDDELGLDRRIRCGVNTGGPIAAGVIGSGKPTFEIIGPAINMAQQMEQHGVPMNVHISRSTYELVYGGSFKIKERGQIEIKQGKVVTYLLNPDEN